MRVARACALFSVTQVSFHCKQKERISESNCETPPTRETKDRTSSRYNKPGTSGNRGILLPGISVCLIGTVDEEFKELNTTYNRICLDTKKFLNEAISYKAAMLSLMNFQVSLVEEHQWHLQELADGQDVGQIISDLQELKNELSGELVRKEQAVQR